MEANISKDNQIAIDITFQHPDVKADTDLLEKLVRAICSEFKLANASISIAIVDDEKTIEVHSQFLNKQNTTDVISFDLSDESEPAKSFELVVNADEAKRQSQARGHSSEAELALYITHGMLHNLGFDDIDENQAEKMHKTEDRILQKEGFGIIYNKQSR
jgi:probable rRNA maturation factor